MRAIFLALISFSGIRTLAGTIPSKRQQLSNGADSAISMGPLVINNLSESTYQCWSPGEHTSTDVTGCRPLLTKIRGFEPYRIPQTFQEYKTPVFPFVPPFGFTVKDCTCELRVKATSPRWVDKFSWNDVRTMATDLVENCQPPRGAGEGGWDLIGPKKKWIVEIVGIEPHKNEALTGLGALGPVGEISIDDDLVWKPLFNTNSTSVS